MDNCILECFFNCDIEINHNLRKRKILNLYPVCYECYHKLIHLNENIEKNIKFNYGISECYLCSLKVKSFVNITIGRDHHYLFKT